MQQMQNATIDPASPEACAAQLIEVVPLVMRTIRSFMRERRGPHLSVPQFRALKFVGRHAGTSLSQVAEHLGLSVPATSRLIDALVEHELVIRQIDQRDRRCVTLDLTEHGSTILAAIQQEATAALAGVLGQAGEDDRRAILAAMEPLRATFGAQAERSASAIDDTTSEELHV
jgi:DNA-binding MarR family transcriptional regulator